MIVGRLTQLNCSQCERKSFDANLGQIDRTCQRLGVRRPYMPESVNANTTLLLRPFHFYPFDIFFQGSCSSFREDPSPSLARLQSRPPAPQMLNQAAGGPRLAARTCRHPSAVRITASMAPSARCPFTAGFELQGLEFGGLVATIDADCTTNLLPCQYRVSARPSCQDKTRVLSEHDLCNSS